MHLLEKLNRLEIVSLGRMYTERWIDEAKNYNDSAQDVLDAVFEKLVKESEDTKSHSIDRINVLQDRLSYDLLK